MSIFDQGLILYKPTQSNRQNFTLLHELGHHLVIQRPEVLSWAADEPDPVRAIEEVCDRFAAHVLVPAELVERVIGGNGLEARHFVTLYETARTASREVCAIALSQRLGCTGFVTLIDRTLQEVQFTARQVDTRPYPWRTDHVPGDNPVSRAAPGHPIREAGWWAYADGERCPYWVDAVADEGYTYAVFSSNDLWNVSSLHIPEVVPDRPIAPWGHFECMFCNFRGTARRFACSNCGKVPCPRCTRCGCDEWEAKSVPCSKCHLRFEPRLIKGGLCVDCRGGSR